MRCVLNGEDRRLIPGPHIPLDKQLREIRTILPGYARN